MSDGSIRIDNESFSKHKLRVPSKRRVKAVMYLTTFPLKISSCPTFGFLSICSNKLTGCFYSALFLIKASCIRSLEVSHLYCNPFYFHSILFYSKQLAYLFLFLKSLYSNSTSSYLSRLDILILTYHSVSIQLVMRIIFFENKRIKLDE